MHGTNDTDIPPVQSQLLADRLRAANVPTTLVQVHGAEHSLATPGQSPTPEQLTTTVADFFTTTLSTPGS
jgi:dipeptidyl aminopeptidase/acylaminoacyl peptidase